MSLAARSLFLRALWTAAYLASRFFLIVCNPRPPCFKQVETPASAMIRQGRPVQRATASQSRLFLRPGLNADFIREIFQARLPLAAFLLISGPLSKCPELSRQLARPHTRSCHAGWRSQRHTLSVTYAGWICRQLALSERELSPLHHLHHSKTMSANSYSNSSISNTLKYILLKGVVIVVIVVITLGAQ